MSNVDEREYWDFRAGTRLTEEDIVSKLDENWLDQHVQFLPPPHHRLNQTLAKIDKRKRPDWLGWVIVVGITLVECVVIVLAAMWVLDKWMTP